MDKVMNAYFHYTGLVDIHFVMKIADFDLSKDAMPITILLLLG